MIVRDAKAVARQWVIEVGSRLPGFAGAFFHGSVNWLPDDALLSATSDVDVMVVLDDPTPPQMTRHNSRPMAASLDVRLPSPGSTGDSPLQWRGAWGGEGLGVRDYVGEGLGVRASRGKFLYRNVLLEVSYLPNAQVRSPEQVLGLSHLAGSFHTASVIRDPSGHLTHLQAAVARDYAKRRWVLRRCAHVQEKILTGFNLDQAAPFPAQVTAWLFPTSLTTHLLLVAGLRNPTVRTRYLAARALLADYGRRDGYETLLALLGCGRLSRERVEEHLDALVAAFAVAKEVIRTPFFFAADISDAGRPVAIDGSRELIARGDHREAIFWLAATYSRCMLVFHHDAPRLYKRFDADYLAFLADLGIASFADLQRRREEVVRSLSQLQKVAEEIVAANPLIEP